jgi:hypothetical protein
VLFALLVLWSARVLVRKDRSEYALLASSWLTLLIGGAVIRFHGSSFPYFIMTAGLFPALALAMPVGRPLALTGRSAWPILVSLIVMAGMQSATESIEMLVDTQSEQSDTLRLVYDSPLRNRRGYQVEGALFCARDPDPIPTMFSQDIWSRFVHAPDSKESKDKFIAEFRKRPVAYIVESYRLNQFPDPIRSFLDDHYMWYAHSLLMAGARIELDGDSQHIDIIVDGKYRWEPDPAHASSSIRVGGSTIEPQGLVDLTTGAHTVTAPDAKVRGVLILADLPPTERSGLPAFYHLRQIFQLAGRR